MHRQFRIQWSLLALLTAFASPAAFADDHTLDGLEMDVMDANQTPDDAAKLALPETTHERAQHDADRTREIRDDARERQEQLENEAGEDTAEGASGGDHGEVPETEPAAP